MRIEMRCDLQQWSEQIVTLGLVVVSPAEILHHPSPIDIGKQAVIAQTGALQHFWRADKQNIFDRRLRTKFVSAMKRHHAGRQANNQTRAGDNRSSAALLHFKFLRSKISTAPLKAMAA